jgi:NAD(P)-dependent dehydrogenase (short-subunit alcohol dehydrogenase family)
VTGATSGLGFETAKALAAAGAHVVLASRSAAKGAQSVAAILQAAPGAKVEFEPLDLADLGSVRAAASRLVAAHGAIDLLINNAGVMAIPRRMQTVDGFEMQLGANYLGHFALTEALLPALLAAPAPRVVSLSSLAHRMGRLHFDDLQLVRHYTPWGAYGQSKLAMLVFALELDRRAKAQGWALMSNAAHPGWAVTNLQTAGLRMGTAGGPALTERAMRFAEPFLAQSAADGALPTLYAATSPEAEGGAYYGPDGLGEMRGAPKRAQISGAAQDRQGAAKLWAASEAAVA